jgi:YD repeat-containing protein
MLATEILPLRAFARAHLCAAGLGVACVLGWTGLLAETSAARTDPARASVSSESTAVSSPLTDLVVLGSPSQAEQLQAQREAQRLTPEAFAARATSQTAYQHIDGAQAKQLAASTFPRLIEEPVGGAPRLPTGEKITSYESDYTAQVDLPERRHAVIESIAPIARQTSPGHETPIDLNLSETSGQFQPVTPVVALSIPKQLRDGVQIAHTGVSVTPVDGSGAAVSGAEGEIAGADVMYANTLPDADTLVKPTTLGVSIETILRSAQSPHELFFRVGLSPSAELQAAHDGTGGVDVVENGSTSATIPAPSAQDAEGTSVPVTMTVHGNVVAVTVPETSQYRLPIVVDPTVYDLHWQNEYNYGVFYGTEWTFWHSGSAYTAPEHPEGGKWTENISSASQEGEVGGLFYTTRGASQIILTHVEGEWSNPGAQIQNSVLLQTPVSPYTEDYDILPESTEAGRGSGGYACAPSLGCPETTAGPAPPANNNTAGFEQYSLKAGGAGTDTATNAYVELSQEQGPELSFNTTSPTVKNGKTAEEVSNVLYGSGGWLGPHSGAFEVKAKDPGLGLKSYRVLGSGSGDIKEYFANRECLGLQCPEYDYQGYTYQPGTPDGEPNFEAFVEDPVGLWAHIYPQKIKVDGTAPHGIKLTGLQNGSELPLGESHLKVEATDGSGTTPSSGIQSIKVSIDGHEVAGSAASCPVGPCSATTELTLAARNYSSGKHALIVSAMDNAKNLAQEEFTFIVHGASPVSVGPGSVDPSTGQLTLSATDVAPGGGIGVSRTYRSREVGTEGPLGPQWAINLGGDESLTVKPSGDAVLSASGGAETTFVHKTGGEFESPTGDQNLKLEAKEKESGKGVTEYLLKNEKAATSTKFEQPIGAQSAPPAFAGQFGSEPGQLNHPLSSAIDPSGNLWVTNSSSNLVQKYSPTGTLLVSIGSLGTAPGQFSTPWGIAVDPRNGNVYVADQGNFRIQEFSSSGAFLKAIGWGVSKGQAELQVCTSECRAGIAGAGNGQFSWLAGLNVDSSGNLWVVDYGNNRIQEFNEKSEFVRKFGSAGKGAEQLEQPLNIVPSGGNLYITDYGNQRVQEFSATGAPVARFGTAGNGNGQFSGPYGIATDPRSGNLYVVDSGNNRVQQFTAAGAFVAKFGTAGSGSGQFTVPTGVAVGPSGNIYVLDNTNNRIEQWTRATWVPSEAGGPISAMSTTFTYKTVEREGEPVVEPTEALSPVPTGVSCGTKVQELTRGCRALSFNYAETTTATGENESEWGDYKGNLTRVYYHAWDPAKGEMTEPAVAQYAYDAKGRLRAEWDPRISPALKTIYGYDAEGHVTAITPSGQASWGLIYGTVAGSSSAGRLLKLTRPATIWNRGTVQNTEKPTLSGERVVGATMGVSNGKWSNNPIAYGYQWEDCNSSETECAPIPGATNSTYKVMESDTGHLLIAVVTATNGGGSISVKSNYREIQAFAFTKYGLPSENYPYGITSGADGNLWFTTYKNKIAKISTSGTITEYQLPSGRAGGITSGPDGNLWFTESAGDAIGDSTTSGAITLYPLPEHSGASGICTGPDGDLWFTEQLTNRIAKITTAGKITEYPSLPSNSSPWSITAGPDGNLWFTEPGTSKVGKITTAGIVTEYALPAGSQPSGITAGADGMLWVAEHGTDKIAKITTSGAITEYALPTIHAPSGITAGPEGAVWFSDEVVTQGGVNEGYVGRITTSGAISESAVPGAQTAPVTTGPEGNLWVAAAANIEKLNGTFEQGKGASLEPGTTIEYGVPASGGSAPYALGAKETLAWGQNDDPVEGVAIFPPDEPTGWPAATYKAATVHYWDARGRLVNTALPTGGIATSEYNETNDVVRSLSADNREAALMEGSNSGPASRLLDTESTYSANGTQLLETRGPQHKVKLASGPEVAARNHVKYFYDEGAPGGQTYNLLTKTTDGAEYEGKEADVRATTDSYSGQGNLGWNLRKPTSSTSDPGGLNLTRTTVYDESTGNTLETTSPAGAAPNPIPTYSQAFGGLGSGEGQFAAPWGVAVNQKTGNAYVSAYATNRVEEFSSTGKFIAWVGSSGSGPGQMTKPEAIAVDSSGNIWVGDSGNERIDEFNEKGEFVRSFGTKGSSEGQFAGAIDGITFNSSHIWVSDTNDNRVEKFSLTGTPEGSFGALGAESGQFQAPTGIVLTSSHIYVADYANHRVQEFSTAGKYVAQFGTLGAGNGQLESPVGIAADPKSGDLFVSDYGSSRVEEFTPTGAFVAWLGSVGSGNGQFNHPDGVATSASGTLYVVDSANTRVSVWEPGYSGARTSQTIYYSLKGNTKYPACGKHAEWANMPCKTLPAAQPNTPGISNLPVTMVTYTMWSVPETITETFGSVTRTKRETFDAAGRALTSEVSSSVDTPLPKVTNEYNTQTGALEKQSTTTEGKTKTITSAANTLGQLEKYTDADGVTSTYSYDVDGRVREVNYGEVDGATAGQIYSYSATTGLMTKLVDSTAGTFKAAYDVEGRVSTENYPNGIKATYTRDQAGDTTGIEYKKTSNCSTNCVWFNDSITPAIHGETLRQSSTLAEEPSYTYDAAGRLTEVHEVPTGKGCTTRDYAYDEEANRTDLVTRPPGPQGECTSAGGSLEPHSYDSAGRLNDTGVTYDALGNVTALPAADAGGHELKSSYYVDNQIASQEQEQAGKAKTISFAYDPAGRTRETLATGQSAVISHYAGSGESLTWTSEGAAIWSRNIPGIDGTLCATQSSGQAAVLELHDLQGNIVATASLSETETKLLSTYGSTEFGVPQPGTSAPKYAWLGAAGVSSELPSSGVVTTGAGSYVPQIGRPLQSEAVASPGAFPDGTGGTGIVQATYLEAAADQFRAVLVEHQAAVEAAARREAEERAAREACPPTACQVDGPGEGNFPEPGEGGAEEYVDPTHDLKFFHSKEAVTVGEIFIYGGLAAKEEAEELAGPLGAAVADFTFPIARQIGEELVRCGDATGGGDSRNGCLLQLHTLGIPTPWGTIDTFIPTSIATVPCYYYKKAYGKLKRGLHCA